MMVSWYRSELTLMEDEAEDCRHASVIHIRAPSGDLEWHAGGAVLGQVPLRLEGCGEVQWCADCGALGIASDPTTWAGPKGTP